MTNLTTGLINEALQSIEAAERDPDHPRSIARRRVAEWRSNAETQGLPRVNEHDVHGAPLLDVSKTLNYHDHDARLGRK